MKHVICPVCGCQCVRNGKNKSGTQRWLCKECSASVTPKIDHSAKQLETFLAWLFSKQTQKDMSGEGRSFRRKTSRFWEIWPLPPKIEDKRDVLYVDGIYIGRKACVLICCDEKFVLGWYLCRYEHAGAYQALLSRIAEPTVVVSDGGTGFGKAVKKVWPHAKLQRCVFHVFCQVRRYTTSRPKTPSATSFPPSPPHVCTAPLVSMLSTTGHPPGYAWCGGSPWGSPLGLNRQCGGQCLLLS